MRTPYGREVSDAIVLAHWDNLVLVGDDAGGLDRSRGVDKNRSTGRAYAEEIERQHRWIQAMVEERPYDERGEPQVPLRLREVEPGCRTLHVLKPVVARVVTKADFDPFEEYDRERVIDFNRALIKDTYGSGKALEVSVAYDPWNRIWYRSGKPKRYVFVEGWHPVAELVRDPGADAGGPAGGVPGAEGERTDRAS